MAAPPPSYQWDEVGHHGDTILVSKKGMLPGSVGALCYSQHQGKLLDPIPICKKVYHLFKVSLETSSEQKTMPLLLAVGDFTQKMSCYLCCMA